MKGAMTALMMSSAAISGRATSNVLIVGDSMGEFSGKSLESYCTGARVQNAAIGGTTALDWANFDSSYVEGCDANQVDMVWMSIGGNDMLGSGCSATVETLKTAITSGINNIKTLVSGSPEFILTGYCMPQMGGEADGCNSPGDFENLFMALQQAAAETGVTYVESVGACGGSSSTYSEAEYFFDRIHLNNRGYCTFFARTEAQTAFGCGAATYDCSAVNCDIPGLNEQCAGTGTISSCEECEASCSGSSSSNNDDDDDGANSGNFMIYVACGVAGLFVLAILALLAVCCCRRRRDTKHKPQIGGPEGNSPAVVSVDLASTTTKVVDDV